MAAIAALVENFEGGTNGALITSSNTAFTTTLGTAVAIQPTFSTTAHEGSLSCRFVTTAQTAWGSSSFTATPLVWVGGYIRVGANPTANTAIFAWFNGTTRIGEIRLTTAGALQLRNSAFSSVYTTASLSLNTWYRFAIRIQPGVAHQVKLYAGANLDGTVPAEDSGSIAETTSAQTVVTKVEIGVLSSGTMDWHLDRLRGDDATEPTGLVVSAPVVSAGWQVGSISMPSGITSETGG